MHVPQSPEVGNPLVLLMEVTKLFSGEVIVQYNVKSILVRI